VQLKKAGRGKRTMREGRRKNESKREAVGFTRTYQQGVTSAKTDRKLNPKTREDWGDGFKGAARNGTKNERGSSSSGGVRIQKEKKKNLEG